MKKSIIFVPFVLIIYLTITFNTILAKSVKELEKLTLHLQKEEEGLHILNIELSHMMNPRRLSVLAGKYLDLVEINYLEHNNEEESNNDNNLNQFNKVKNPKWKLINVPDQHNVK